MTAPQDLVALAQRLGMGKVTQEALAAFAREVLAGQAIETAAVMESIGAQPGEEPHHAAERVRYEWTRTHEFAQQQAAEVERLKGLLDLAQRKTLQDVEENERLRTRLEAVQQEASANLERAEKAEVRLQQVQAALATVRHADDNTRAFAQAFCETAEEAEQRANTPAGGQSVPNHGDFAHVPPSTRGQLRWWVKCGRSALKGESSLLLARARNEGLEKAAGLCAEAGHPSLAAAIDAMKEAES